MTIQNHKLLAEALNYLDEGYSVLPLRGKRANFFPWGEYMEDKTPTEDEVKKWFDTYEGITGIGIVTGYVQSLAVLDLEKEENPQRLDIPDTAHARSGGGGNHYYFRIPDGLGGLPSVNLRKHGIVGDLKADGGYITAPPSIHPETHDEYKWIKPLSRENLADIPAWLLDKAKESSDWERKDWAETMLGAKEGERHNTTLSVMGKFLRNFRREEWDSIVLPSIMAWNENYNKPPLPSKEVLSIYESLARKESSGQTGNPSLPKRKPLSVSEILSMPEGEKPEFLVKWLVPEKGITAMSGHPGCGKSWLMLHLAQCVATGEPFLGQFQTKKGNVLIVDEESGIWEMKRRMEALRYPEDLPITFYSQNGFKIDKEQDLNELTQTIRERDIRLVVIDPFVAIHSKIENNAEDAQQVMEQLQKFNMVDASVLFIHHHRKGLGTGGQSLRGSSAFSGRIDSHIMVEKTDGLAVATLDITHVKSRRCKNVGPFRALLTQEAESDPVCLVYDESSGSKEIKVDKAKRIILELLKIEEMFKEEIVSEVKKEEDIGHSNILRALKYLENDRQVASKWEGRKKKYRLSDETLLTLPEKLS